MVPPKGHLSVFIYQLLGFSTTAEVHGQEQIYFGVSSQYNSLLSYGIPSESICASKQSVAYQDRENISRGYQA